MYLMHITVSVHDIPFLRPYVSIYVTRKVVGAQRIVILEEENGATKRPQGLCGRPFGSYSLRTKTFGRSDPDPRREFRGGKLRGIS